MDVIETLLPFMAMVPSSYTVEDHVGSGFAPAELLLIQDDRAGR